MQICSNDHDEVAFAGAWSEDCPACLYAEEIRDEMQETINEIRSEIEDLEARLEEERRSHLDD